MSKIAIFSDPHFHAFSAFKKAGQQENSRLQEIEKAVLNIKATVREQAVPYTILAGDVTHTFSYVENDVLNTMTRVFEDWPGELFIVPGNHDLKLKHSYTRDMISSAVLERLRGGNVTILDGSSITREDLSVTGLGYRTQAEFKAAAEKTLQKKAAGKTSIFVGHQLIENPYVPGGMKIPQAIKESFDLLIFGDVHQGCLVGEKILIPGAPLQHNYTDEDGKRGFWLYDTTTRMISFIENTESPRFITLEDAKDYEKDVKNYYRILTNSKKKKITAENVIIAQQKIKQEFRESTISRDQDDKTILKEYMRMRGDTGDALAEKGYEFLHGCTTDALTPTKLKLQKIRVENYGSFRGVTEFTFDEGLYNVSGPNGSGKTTLFEAWFWGQYGETTKGIPVDELINDHEKYCAVEILYKGNDQTLRVERYRKHPEYKNEFRFTMNDGAPIQRESNAETQKELNRLVGSSARFSKNVNYFSQEGFEFFSSLTDAGQKELCKNLLQLDRFEKAAKRVDEKATKLDGEYNTLHDRVTRLEASLSTLEQSMTNLEEEALTEDTRREDATRMCTEAMQEIEKKLEEYRGKVVVLTNAILEKDQEITKKTEKFDAKKYDEDIAKRSETIKDHHRRLEEQVANMNSEIRALKTRTHRTEEKIRTLEGSLTKLRYAEKMVRDDVLTKEQEIARLDIDELCPTCGKEMKKEEKDKLRSATREQKKTLEETLTKSCMQIKTLTVDIQNLKTKLDIKRTAIEEEEQTLRNAYQQEVGRYEQERSELTRLLEARQEAERIFAVEQENKLHNEKSARTDLHHEKNNVLALKMAEEEKYRRIQNELAAITTTENRWRVRLTETKQQIADLRKERESLTAEYEGLSKEQDILNYWKQGFSNQGIMSYLLDDFAKKFTEKINLTLLNITRGKYAAMLLTQRKLKSTNEYREKFDFIIYIDDKKRSYKALSGGEKARVNLATALTLNDLVKEYYNLDCHPFGFMVLDELFTYLDVAGIESVYDELLQKTKGSAVYVITNKEEVASLFPSTITAAKDQEKGTQLTTSN